MASSFLKAEWRKLAIANYAVDPGLLLPYLPYKTELDVWNGKCYVSLVGFKFVNTRLRGIPIPFHRNFEEVNLRFYVRYKDESGWRRGVTFIREIVPRPAITFIANTLYKEKYMTKPMKHEWDISTEKIAVKYAWKHNKKWNSFAVNAEGVKRELKPGSEEEFITEHYWGYAPIRKNMSTEYGVEHPRWQTYNVNAYRIEVDFASVYGPEFNFLDQYKPDSVMLAEGSEIVVRTKRKII